jgi:hypothetical protein
MGTAIVAATWVGDCEGEGVGEEGWERKSATTLAELARWERCTSSSKEEKVALWTGGTGSLPLIGQS